MAVFRIHKKFNSYISSFGGYYTYKLQCKTFFVWKTLHKYSESYREDAYKTLAELQGRFDPNGRPKQTKPEDNRAYNPMIDRTTIPPKSTYPSNTESNKPPIGIVPKSIYEEKNRKQRFKDLLEDIGGYVEYGQKIPVEWIKEFNETVNLLNEQHKQ